MSEWTYVRGCLELNSSPFEIKKDFNEVEPKREDFETDEAYEEAVDKYRDAYHKAIYLPFPEEQFKLGAPIAAYIPDYSKKKKKNKYGFYTYPEKKALKFDGTCIYSLPRAKPIIEEAFKLFPQGELGFRYTLDQNNTDSHSSIGGFIHNCLYKYYHNAVDKMYKSFERTWCTEWNFKDLKKYIGIEEDCSYDCISEIICGINTSLRYATATEVLDSLEKFIKYLKDNEISIDHGYLEWFDTCCRFGNYRYAFRVGDWHGEYTIMKLDWETNRIIWQKKYVHPKKASGKGIDFDRYEIIEESFTDTTKFDERLNNYLDILGKAATMSKAEKVDCLIKSGVLTKDLEPTLDYKGIFELSDEYKEAYRKAGKE